MRLQEEEKRKKKKSGHCHSRSLSAVNSLYKSHKRKASQNDVAKKEGGGGRKNKRDGIYYSSFGLALLGWAGAP